MRPPKAGTGDTFVEKDGKVNPFRQQAGPGGLQPALQHGGVKLVEEFRLQEFTANYGTHDYSPNVCVMRFFGWAWLRLRAIGPANGRTEEERPQFTRNPIRGGWTPSVQASK